MVRTRIRSDQGEDIGFISEREFNDFFAEVVITGTNEETDIITTFDNYLPNRGIFVGSDGNVVTTGTNTINIAGFYTEFVSSSGTLQDEIDAIVVDQAGIGSITASGITVTGTVIFDSLEGITLIPNASTNTITFSGTPSTGAAGITDINSETGPSVTLVGAGDVTVSTSASNVITISGIPTLFPEDAPENAIVGGVGIVVTSGSNETTIDGHLRYTKDENDAIIGGVGITVTSGSNTITVDGHLRYQKNENDAVLGTDGNTVISGSDTITVQGFRPEFVAASGSLQEQIDAVEGSDVDSVNALLGDVLIVDGVNSTATTNVGANSIQIDTFDDDDVDSITASGVTVTGSVQFATLGGLSVSADASTDTVTISGGSEVGELIGSLFQIEFTNGGNTSNTWLAVSDSNLSGNRTPWVACFPCRLAGLSFSNRNDGTTLDLEVHVARVGDGNTNNLEFTYQIISARTAFKTNLALDTLELNPGDKVSVYAQNTGSQGRDVWFGIFWEITNRTTDEGSENWTGDIS